MIRIQFNGNKYLITLFSVDSNWMIEYSLQIVSDSIKKETRIRKKFTFRIKSNLW